VADYIPAKVTLVQLKANEGFTELEYLLSMVQKWERKLGCHLMLDHNPIILGILSVFFCCAAHMQDQERAHTGNAV